MKDRRPAIFIVTLGLMVCGIVALAFLKEHQKLGTPGIMAKSRPGTVVMDLELPERVLDFTSTNVPEPQKVVDWLPKDTSYAERHYQAADEVPPYGIYGTIVMMGTDRTSIHKPEYCLPGQGFSILKRSTETLSIGGPHPYQLPVAKWVVSNLFQQPDGRKVEIHGLYVFWFVAPDEFTTSNWERIWWLTRDLVTKGVLQRWAYVSYFALCMPGQEDATFERMKGLITASVPEFQLPPRSSEGETVAAQ